jgi:hypothetical protein
MNELQRATRAAHSLQPEAYSLQLSLSPLAAYHIILFLIKNLRLPSVDSCYLEICVSPRSAQHTAHSPPPAAYSLQLPSLPLQLATSFCTLAQTIVYEIFLPGHWGRTCICILQ